MLKKILQELVLIRRELEAIRLDMRRRSTNIHIDSRELAKSTKRGIKKELRDIKKGRESACSENS